MDILLVFAAALPILLLLVLMTVFKWGGTKAGPASWLAGLVISLVLFGLNMDVFLVSQAKALIYALFVLLVLWTALLLYNLNNEIGGITALTAWLEALVPEKSLLLILIAWAFTGVLEGIAGFGLPIAVAAPMLVSLGVPALNAIAAAAIGHSWAVTFGNMGMVFQNLVSISDTPEAMLVPLAGVLLGIANLLTGLAVAHILGGLRHWKLIVLLSMIMSGVQYGVAALDLLPLSGFTAALTGLIAAILISRKKATGPDAINIPRKLWATFASYGLLSALTLVVFSGGGLHDFLYRFNWQAEFPQVVTANGFVTPAGHGQTFRWFLYPGTLLLIAYVFSYFIFCRMRLSNRSTFKQAFARTARSAVPATLGVVSTVGLSVMMDHTGMTQLLAVTLSDLTGRVFPLVSPVIGMLGTFATGSNTNSNVLFVPLQQDVAGLLHILPLILLAAQTAGGSLGSMIAPAKLIVGTANANLAGGEGRVLAKTLPYAALIVLGIGLAVLVLSYLYPV